MKRLFFFLAMWAATSAFVQAQMDLPVTFDAPGITYVLTDFGNASSVLGADPTGAINQVAISTKPANAETWAGTTIGPPSGFVNPVPFTATVTKVSMRVYSPAVGLVVMLKPENVANGGINIEKPVTTTKANEWETLVFDFSSGDLTKVYGKLSVFFNFGANGTAYTFYWDDVMMDMSGTGGPVKSQIDLPVTFNDTTVSSTLTDFGGAASSVAMDPTGGTNRVGKSIKTKGAETWAGTTMGVGSGFKNLIPLTANNAKMTMRVYSPIVGAPVRLKAEVVGDATKSVETETLTTVANAWETLTFDFNNQATGTAALNLTYPLQKLSAFFNFGTSGSAAGELTFYWDDVYLFGTTGVEASAISNLKHVYDAGTRTLSVNSDQFIQEVRVYNLTGQQVALATGTNQAQSLSLAHLANGVYVVKASVANQSQAFKIIVQ